MPGNILDVLVSTGDKVAKGDPLLILEAMKMENVIKAPTDVTIQKINVLVGDNVEKNQTLIEF
jgi:biotin carboxyl carrier protein